MQVSDSAIGIMDGAFFVPKTQLLDWVNSLLDLSLTKVEQCASGAVYCQIIDSMYPGKVAMKKVNWSAKLEYEFVNNYKILQKGFDECGIAKHIDVDKLIRGKFQDNLEFLQWIKSFSSSHNQNDSYDAPSRRYGSNMPEWAIKSRGKATPELPGRAGPSPERRSPPQLKRLQDDLENMERERDFYFGKLREIEILSEEHENSPEPLIKSLIARIQSILFCEEPSAVLERERGN